MKLSKPLLLCCALATAFLAAAVAGPTGAIAAGSEDLTGPVVKIFDDRLSPATTHVAPLSAVTWVNEGQRSHEVRSDSGAWQTFRLQPGARQSVTFRAAGRFPYKVDEVEGLVVVAGAVRRESGPHPEDQGVECRQVNASQRECVFRYHVAVEGSVHTQFTQEPPAAELTKATLNWRADYPKVDVRVTQYPQGVVFEPVKGDGQGTIELEFIGEFHDRYTKECAITIRLPHMAASVLLGGGSGFQRRDFWHFDSRLTDAGIQVFFDAQTSAVPAACKAGNRVIGQGDNFHAFFHIRGFPLLPRTGRPEDETFTTADGLIWAKASLWMLDVGIEGGGGPPPLGFPLNLLKEGKPFTMSTGRRVGDRPGSNWVEHNEGMITVTFSRP